MLKLLLIGATFVAYVAANCLVCPEVLLDDTQAKYCASNKYGSTSVTQSFVSNWNCLHPQNKYTFVSSTMCTPALTCTTNCDTLGPSICGELQNPSGGPGTTRSVFINQCEFDKYICNNPKKTYKNLGHLDSCMSPYYISQMDLV